MASPDTSDQTEKETASSAEEDSSDESEKNSRDTLECAVCLQTCIRPVRLPCSHIFCYLCVKGVIHQSKRCAMCRQPIPSNYLDNPELISAEYPTVAFEGSYQWFYEGKNGWWQYDERTSTEIETAYKNGEKNCEVLIAGFLYVIDFENNIQMRRNDPIRRRKIKRDLISIPKKGVAGIRLPSQPDSSEELPCLQTLDISQDDNLCCSQAKAASGEGSSSGPSSGAKNEDEPPINKRKRKGISIKAVIVPCADNVQQPVISSTTVASNVEPTVEFDGTKKEDEPPRNKGIRKATKMKAVIVPSAASSLPVVTSSITVSSNMGPTVQINGNPSSPGSITIDVNTSNVSGSTASSYRVSVGRSIVICPSFPSTVVSITHGLSNPITRNSEQAIQRTDSTCEPRNRSSSNESLPPLKKSKTDEK